jgi:lipopolysaccharide export system protein LptA
MNIEADAMRYDDKAQTSVFTGNVVLTKGTIVMRGARLQVRQNEQGEQFGEIQGEAGKRAFFRQKREGVNEFIEGESETIEYDSKTDSVRFLRRAEMRRLIGARTQDEVYGSVIVYDNKTEVYTVDGAQSGLPSAAPGQRVHVVLPPRVRPAASAAASAAAPRLKPSGAMGASGGSAAK